MSANQEGNPAPNPAPASRRTPTPFMNGCYAGFAIAVFPMLIANALFGERPNVLLCTFAVTIALWLTLLTYKLVRQSAPLSHLAGLTLAGLLMPMVSMTQPAGDLTREYHSIPLVEQFGYSDFARFSGGADSLSVNQLQAVLDAQTGLQNAIASVEQSEQAVDASPISDAEKAVVRVADAAAEAAIKAQLMSPEQMSRLQAVQKAACDASDNPRAAPNCTVTQADLLNFGIRFHHDYAIWLVLLQAIGAV